jgi:LAS superfamily LD-carboxypeptidase LdcB
MADAAAQAAPALSWEERIRLQTRTPGPAVPGRRVTRRRFLAAVAATALTAAGCQEKSVPPPAPAPAPALQPAQGRLVARPAPPIAPPQPTPTAALPPLVRLVSSGIERDSAGRIVRAFGFDPDTAREVLFPVTKARALPADYAPQDLVPTHPYGVQSRQPLRAILGADLAEMQEASGGALWIVSGYRSYSYQEALFERYVDQQVAAGLDRSAAIEWVNRSSARPGHSEHQLGLAIDFNSVEDDFASTRSGRWLYDEAWRYGFVLSYTRLGQPHTGYQYEPWHYRWVGRPLARLLAEQGYLDDDEPTPADYYEAIWSLLAEA